MTDDRLHALLSGYAAGTLTTEERQALFAAAAERQDLFNSLMEAEPLRETLRDPAIKAKLLADLAPARPKPVWSWRWRPRMLAAAGGIAVLLVAGVTISRMFRERTLMTAAKPVLISRGEREKKPVLMADSRLPEVPSKKSARPQQQARQEEQVGGVIGGVVGGVPSRESATPEPERPNSLSAASATKLETPSFDVRLSEGESLNSPRALYLSSQSASALAARQLRLEINVTAENNPAPPPPSSPRLLLPVNAAIRLTFHAPGTAMGLDWRAPLPADSLLRVDPTVAGYITVVTSDGGTQPNVLLASQGAVSHSPVDVSMANLLAGRKLTVIYSVEPLPQQSLSDAVKSGAGKIEAIHTPAEQALYVSPEKPSVSIAANLRIELR